MLWAVLLQLGIHGQLLTGIKSLHVCIPMVCICVDISVTTKLFRVSAGLRKASLFHLYCYLFNLYGINSREKWVLRRSKDQ